MMVDIIVDSINAAFVSFFDSIMSPVRNQTSQLFEYAFSDLNSSLSDAMSNPILQAIVMVAGWLALAVWLVSIPFFLIKIVQEDKRDWRIITECFVKSILFVVMNPTIAHICFFLPNLIVSSFTYFVGGFKFDSVMDALGSGLTGSILQLVLWVAGIGFFVVIFMRVGAVFIQMLIAPFYVPYVLMGDHQKVSEWILGTVAAGFTYVVQYATFYCGVLILQFGGFDLTNILIGLSLLFSTFTVPKLMQHFGWSSGAGHTFGSLTHSMSQLLISAVRRR